MYGKDIFYKDDLNSYYKKDNFQELSKFALKYLIDRYHNQISDYYKDLESKLLEVLYNRDRLDKSHISNIGLDLHTHFRSFSNEWREIGGYNPYNLDKNAPYINSKKLEYLIYEIISIYRETDWDNYSLISYEI